MWRVVPAAEMAGSLRLVAVSTSAELETAAASWATPSGPVGTEEAPLRGTF